MADIAKSSRSMRPYFESPLQSDTYRPVGNSSLLKPEDSVSKSKAAKMYKRKPNFQTREKADLSSQIHKLETHMQLAANDDPWVGYKEHGGLHGHIRDLSPHPTDDSIRYKAWFIMVSPIPNNVRYIKDREKCIQQTINSERSNPNKTHTTDDRSLFLEYYHCLKSRQPSAWSREKKTVIYTEQNNWFKGRVPLVEDMVSEYMFLKLGSKLRMATSIKDTPIAKSIPETSEQLELPTNLSASREELKSTELPYPEDHDDIKSYYRLWLLEHREDTSHNVPDRTFCSAKQLWKNKRLYKSILNKSTVKMYYKSLTSKPVAKVSRPVPANEQRVVPRTFGNRVREVEPQRPEKEPSLAQKAVNYLWFKLTKGPIVTSEVAESVITSEIIAQQAIDSKYDEVKLNRTIARTAYGLVHK